MASPEVDRANLAVVSHVEKSSAESNDRVQNRRNSVPSGSRTNHGSSKEAASHSDHHRHHRHHSHGFLQQQQGGGAATFKKQVTFEPLGPPSSAQVDPQRKKNNRGNHGRNSGAVSGDEEGERQAKRGHGFKGPLRKRSYSFTEGHNRASSNIPPNKRWKFARKKGGYLNKNSLPSKFLLGGNIHDPLNLNSLSDEKISKMVNAFTPQSSPLPTPKHRKAEYKIEVLIPPNISDPLNLNCGVDENEYESQLISPGVMSSNKGNGSSCQLKKKKFRYRKRARSTAAASGQQCKNLDIFSEESDGEDQETASCSNHPLNCSLDPEKLSVVTNEKGDTEEKEKKLEEAGSPEKSTLKKCEAVKKEEEEENRLSSATETLSSNNEDKKSLKRPLQLQGTTGPSREFSKRIKTSETVSNIVSPVVPQPGQKPNQFKQHNLNTTKNQLQTSKNGKKANTDQKTNIGSLGRPTSKATLSKKTNNRKAKFEFGNYNRYYGYRTPDQDMRLKYFKPEWFDNKDVLDVGCNVGLITMAIGKQFRPRSIVGMDIDKRLIATARRNLSRYESCAKPDGKTIFPSSLPILFGPLNHPAASALGNYKNEEEAEDEVNVNDSSGFPRNVRFIAGNYVLDSDELLEATQQEFDVIYCLSTTKWIHLNHGDAGLKRAFKRMYAQLRPGGLLILEAQPYASYTKRKKLTDRIYENFQNIKLLPENFPYYLLHEVGFASGETIVVPHHSSKGFQRPIQLFLKGQPFSSRSASSRQTTPYQQGFTTPYGEPSPKFRAQGRCYAPSLTPMYNKPSPLYPQETPPHRDERGKDAKKKSSSSNVNSPRPGTSSQVSPNPDGETVTFPRPRVPPESESSSPVLNNFIGSAPNYSPGDTPGYTGYSGYTPGRSGITPGYSGPSPEHLNADSPPRRSHSPVYSGPDPGVVSNASTPGHAAEGDYLGPGYTPSYSGYTPSHPGTPSYSPRQPRFSPGNATPTMGSNPPSVPASPLNPSSVSPKIQQSEITGNTTPHPGPSGSSPPVDDRNPRYSWYGGSSSGGNTPQSAHEGPTSPQVIPTHYLPADMAPPPSDDSNAPVSDPNSPGSPFQS